MKKYTFEDWLNDRIPENIFEGIREYYNDGLIDKQDYNTIRECQLEAYDEAVKMNIDYLKWSFARDYKNSPNKEDFYQTEIRNVENDLNDNLIVLRSILRGAKDTNIKGHQYKRITESVSGGAKYFFGFNDHMRIEARYKYLQWLREKLTGSKPDTEKLSLRQVALINFYEGNRISRENASEIATKYGYKSGQKLYQYYSFYLKNTNRRAYDLGSENKLINKIKLFESILKYLSDKGKALALDEIKILKPPDKD